MYNKKIDECLFEIENCSTFDSSIIIPIITNLVSIFEGEKYISQLYYFKTDKESKNIIMIISELYLKNNYNERYLYSLVKKGNAIIIETDEYCNDTIKFYKSDQLHRINQCVNFKNFPYVKEFIDYLIDYKTKNNMLNLSKEIIICLEAEFIKSKLEQIKYNYDKKDEESKIKLDREIKHNNKIRERKLKKILRRI